MRISRRSLILGGLPACVALAVTYRNVSQATAGQTFEVTHTPEEWHKLLTPEQFHVLREAGTEHPFTSPLLDEKRTGIFACAGCDLDSFSSANKYDSGTGWPSFWAPLKGGGVNRAPAAASCSAPRCIAAAAEGIWAMSSTMARSPPACVTASMASP